jgi:hypothetical protein
VIVSPKTVNKHNVQTSDSTDASSAAISLEDSVQLNETLTPIGSPTPDEAQASAPTIVTQNHALASEATDPRVIDVAEGVLENDQVTGPEPLEAAQVADAIEFGNDLHQESVPVGNSTETMASGNSAIDDPLLVDAAADSTDSSEPENRDAEPNGQESPSEESDTRPSAPSVPDPSTISARLRNLVVAVGQVEELSRRAREIAATDLAFYSGIAASHRQFEEGLAEAQRIGQEAQAVYQRAFGWEAKALAEPALLEAREVEQAFAELADSWRQQAETFLAEHPDVEALLTEQRQQEEDARRREAARTRAERFQQLVTATDAALRQGLLDDARDCLKLLGREFPAEADRIASLQERLDHRVRAANDAAARRVLLHASELQGRGDFEAAVKLLEAVDVQGLSREASEDVFGRWSAACSLLGQTGGLDLLRYSPAQGRGIVVHRDPAVPYGLVVFSTLGMGPSYFEGRVVSAADREGSVITARARPFRAAELPSDVTAGWYGRSYVVPSSASAGEPVRH